MSPTLARTSPLLTTNGESGLSANMVGSQKRNQQFSESEGGPSKRLKSNVALDDSNGTVIPALSQDSCPAINGTATQQSYRLLVWSAKSEDALARILHQHAQYLEEFTSESDTTFDQLAQTLATKRNVMSWRSFAVASTRDSIANVMLSSPLIRSSPHNGLAIVFTGQGAQYPNMGLDLLEYPVFRSTLERAGAQFRDLGADWSILGMFRQFLAEILLLT